MYFAKTTAATYNELQKRLQHQQHESTRRKRDANEMEKDSTSVAPTPPSTPTQPQPPTQARLDVHSYLQSPFAASALDPTTPTMPSIAVLHESEEARELERNTAMNSRTPLESTKTFMSDTARNPAYPIKKRYTPNPASLAPQTNPYLPLPLNIAYSTRHVWDKKTWRVLLADMRPSFQSEHDYIYKQVFRLKPKSNAQLDALLKTIGNWMDFIDDHLKNGIPPTFHDLACIETQHAKIIQAKLNRIIVDLHMAEATKDTSTANYCHQIQQQLTTKLVQIDNAIDVYEDLSKKFAIKIMEQELRNTSYYHDHYGVPVPPAPHAASIGVAYSPPTPKPSSRSMLATSQEQQRHAASFHEATIPVAIKIASTHQIESEEIPTATAKDFDISTMESLALKTPTMKAI